MAYSTKIHLPCLYGLYAKVKEVGYGRKVRTYRNTFLLAKTCQDKKIKSLTYGPNHVNDWICSKFQFCISDPQMLFRRWYKDHSMHWGKNKNYSVSAFPDWSPQITSTPLILYLDWKSYAQKISFSLQTECYTLQPLVCNMSADN